VTLIGHDHEGADRLAPEALAEELVFQAFPEDAQI
jgi:hypothetical protein